MCDESKKVKLVEQLPDPPKVTDSVRRELLAQSRACREAFAERVADMETITADDLRARAR